MEQFHKIPIVVGVTGHRNVCDEDVASLKQQVKEALTDVQSLCNNADTPVVMLCGMAQGADMRCAEVAFDMGIPVYAILPCAKEQFINSFDSIPDRDKLYEYLDKCARIICVPDIEQNKDWITSKVAHVDDDSYWYRQVGVYMAKHSHLMIALWDGKGPAGSYGCGTVEVIEFALEYNYLNKDHLYKSGMISDSAVIWIKTNRNKKDGEYIADCAEREWLVNKENVLEKTDLQSEKYYKRFDSLTKAPDFLTNAISETVAYNKADCQEDNYCHLWADVDELGDYHKSLRKHYIKADKLSYQANQPKYKRYMLALAILGALTAFSFLIYDDASMPFMIIPCTIAVGVIIALTIVCRKKEYHRNYMKYRAFAESLRIQFYLTLSLNEAEGLTNVCDLYSWSQKIKGMWIRKAIRALDIVSGDKPTRKDADFLNKVKEAWIGNCKKPEGQLSYHTRKKVVNKKQLDKLNSATQSLTWITVAFYVLILVFEAATWIVQLSGGEFFWSGTSVIGLTYRSIGGIFVGTLAATSLLMSSFWGKLSFDRLYDDNDRMLKLYQSAYARWTEVTKEEIHTEKEFENFVREIAREEIVENGLWCSYVEENTLDINL